MTPAPDFKQAAYHINRVLNGLEHQWCESGPVDVLAYRGDVKALRPLLPFLRAAQAPLARGLEGALEAVENGKPAANEIVRDALRRIGHDVAAIAAHRVDFSAYCRALSENKARAYAGEKMRDPNICPA